MNSNTPHLSISRILEIDPVKASFVAKIESIIAEYGNRKVPKNLIAKLEAIKNDYIFGAISGVGELKNAILDLASEVAEVL